MHKTIFWYDTRMEVASIKIRKSPVILMFKIIAATIFIYAMLMINSLFTINDSIFFDNFLINKSVFLLIGLCLEVSIIFYLLLQWSFHEYEITNSEIIRRKGVIWKHSGVHSLRDVQSVYVNRHLIGSIFNYGDLIIDNPLTKKDVNLRSIPDVERYAEIMRNVLQNKSNSERVVVKR